MRKAHETLNQCQKQNGWYKYDVSVIAVMQAVQEQKRAERETGCAGLDRQGG